MGFARFQAVFRLYFKFGNVLRTIPYSSPWRGRGEDIWRILGDHVVFQGKQWGIICSQGYTGRTIECDCR